MKKIMIFLASSMLIFTQSCEDKKKKELSYDEISGIFENQKRNDFKNIYGIEYDTVINRLEQSLGQTLTPSIYYTQPLKIEALNERPTEDIFRENIDLFLMVINFHSVKKKLDLAQYKDQRSLRINVINYAKKMLHLQLALMAHENPMKFLNLKDDVLFRNYGFLELASFTDFDYLYEIGFVEYYKNQTTINRFEKVVIVNDYMLRGITYTIQKGKKT